MHNMQGPGAADAQGLEPAAEPVNVAAAERFEVLAGDLLRRMNLAMRRVDGLGATLAPFGIQEAARRLETAVAEHKHDIATPLGEQMSFLVERQGERIRSLSKLHAIAMEGVLRTEAELTAERKAHAETAGELAAWRKRHEHVVLAGESRADLKAFRESCARCGRPKVEHEGDACPAKATRTVNALPCAACGGQVERRSVNDRAVWWCAACAGRGGNEAAGIRGTGE